MTPNEIEVLRWLRDYGSGLKFTKPRLKKATLTLIDRGLVRGSHLAAYLTEAGEEWIESNDLR